ncbi:Polyhydroxyalkanoate depolymerase, intracellular [Methylocella tundrae]|uniref:Polyhydroxyalkanoate depolymerase, intracellular n=1 Tax=Methylocella tundrae TaxID=227605 RepID=A0A8B6M3L3_METTU|nr:polyhydroxyalkanoate depolymerase [Methylocella tundrae]VTZ26960.1 Polyhydroxyalkanoate depolymerase, intracellular [Methylocella tundrae]VTZ48963.1 Polyhydroxyalkanoate depolymerase, intracellular [Methylocella tundrae]
MMYEAYGAQASILDFFRPIAAAAGAVMRQPMPFFGQHFSVRRFAGVLETFANLAITHSRLPFDVTEVSDGGRVVPVTEEVVASTPFASLLRFRKEVDAPQPRVLIVAPMSGHFATLLKATVKTMLAHHDVYITDWHNIRDVPLAAGEFGFDTYVDHVIEFLQVMGPGSHVVAVCQPCVAVLAAVSIMAENGDAAQPRSMTLMAGPIDTRVNPTKVNELAKTKPIEWFEKNLIADVPVAYKGARRKVYPGFMQLAAFVSMNPDRHMQSFKDMAQAHADNDMTKFQFIKSFYEEYFAVMDLPAEFYLPTVQMVFQDHLLPLGKLRVHDRAVKPGAIRRTALLTIEGERDDICGLGQTLAAQDLCTGLRQYMKSHHVQTGVGHYGTFSGRRWTNEIYPKLRDVIEMTSN